MGDAAVARPNLPQFEPEYDYYKMRNLVDELARWIDTVESGESGAGGGNGGGTGVHNDLTGRDAADAHPISAISGLTATLAGLSSSIASNTANIAFNAAGIAANAAAIAALPTTLATLFDTDLTGQAQGDLLFNVDGVNWNDTAGDLIWDPTLDFLQLANAHSINWLDTSLVSQEMLVFEAITTATAGIGCIVANFEDTNGARVHTGDGGRVWTFVGTDANNEISTVASKFGSSSYEVGTQGAPDNDGVFTNVQAENADFHPGLRDWFVRFWFRHITSQTGGNQLWQVGTLTGSNRALRFTIANNVFQLNYASGGGSETTFPFFGVPTRDDLFHEIVLERVGDTILCYEDGIQNGPTHNTAVAADIGLLVQTGDRIVAVGMAILGGVPSGSPDGVCYCDAFEMKIGENLFGGVAPGSPSTSAPAAELETFIVGDPSFKTQLDGNIININDAYEIPVADGTANQHLVTDGAGQVTFEDQGLSGGLLSAEYRFSTSIVAADPGAGRFRFDTAAYSTVTEIFIDDLTDNGVDISNLLALISKGDRLYFQVKASADEFVVFDVIVDAVDNTGWFTIGVAEVASGVFFSNNDKCLMIWSIDGQVQPQMKIYEGMSTRGFVFSDFFEPIQGLQADGVQAVPAGGGFLSVPTAAYDFTDHPGVWGLNTGAGVAGRVFILSAFANNFQVGVGGITRHGVWYQAPAVLSDAVNEYVLRAGIGSIALPNTINQGIFFEYQFDQNGGRWQALTEDGVAETTVDTGITVAVSTYYLLEWEINALGTSVEYFIDQVSVATITTNIPSGLAFEHFMNEHIMKLAGVANRASYIDAYYFYQEIDR